MMTPAEPHAVTAVPEPETSDPAGGLVGFLDGLSGREQRLEQRAGVLQTVVTALSDS